MKNKVLLVDDSQEIFQLVQQAVGGISELLWAESIGKAQELMNGNTVDLVLMDIGLPDGNGIEYCSRLQTTNGLGNVPIFFLTAHGALAEKVLGFSAGADDYIVKPFSVLELRARVEAKLKKLNLHREQETILKWKNIEIYPNSQEVRVIDQGRYSSIDLTALEFKLLTYLASRPGDVFSRDDILSKVWGDNLHVYPRSVDTHISKLRKKLGEASDAIRSVHGTGYRFVPDAS